MKNIYLFCITFCLMTKLGFSQTYQLTRGLPIAEIVGSGTIISGLTDDDNSSAIPIGFNFNYYGSNYSTFYLGSNGIISFGTGYSGPYGTSLPNSSAPNSIFFANGDLHCGRGTPTINYFVSGSAPNRILVINFKNVQHYYSPSNLTSVQIQLFEGSNKIDLHISSITSGYTRTIGLQNNTLSNFVTENSINSNSSLTITNEAFRFLPVFICPYQITISGSSGNCVTNGNTLTANISPPDVSGITYQWYRNSVSINGATNSTYFASLAGTYVVKVFNSNQNCIAESSAYSLYSGQKPQFEISQVMASGDYDIKCSGSQQKLKAISITPDENPATSYSWSGPNGFNSTESNTSSFTLQPNTTGTYTVTINLTCGNAITLTKKIVIENNIFVGNQRTVCPGSTANLYYQTPTNFPTSQIAGVSWTGPNGFTSTLNSPDVLSLNSSKTGFYSCYVSVTGCPNLFVSRSGVNLSQPIVEASYYTQVTKCDSAYLNASANSPANYNWTGPNGFSSTTQNPRIKLTDGGVYTLTAQLTSGCTGTLTKLVHVKGKQKPELNFTLYSTSVIITSVPFCNGNSFTLPSYPYSSYAVSWTGPNGFTSQQISPTVPNASIANAGTYTASISDPTCPLPLTKTVTATLQNCTTNPCPVLTVSPSINICKGSDAKMSASNGSNSFPMNWTGPNGFIATGNDIILHDVQNSGTYTVSTLAYGCGGTFSTMLTATVNVSIIDGFGLLFGVNTDNIKTTVCEGNQDFGYFNPLNSNLLSYEVTGPNGYIFYGQGSTYNYGFDIGKPSISGSYNIESILNLACNNGTFTFNSPINLSINALPSPPSISTNNLNILPGSSTNILGIGCSNINNLMWNYDYIGSPITVSPPITTNYWAYCSQGGCNGPSSNILTISVNNCLSLLSLSKNVPSENFSSGTVLKEANQNNGVIIANNLISGSARVNYRAKNILLNPGFVANNGTVFSVEVGGCN